MFPKHDNRRSPLIIRLNCANANDLQYIFDASNKDEGRVRVFIGANHLKMLVSKGIFFASPLFIIYVY